MAKEVQTEVKLNHRQCLLTVIPEADMAERPTSCLALKSLILSAGKGEWFQSFQSRAQYFLTRCQHLIMIEMREGYRDMHRTEICKMDAEARKEGASWNVGCIFGSKLPSLDGNITMKAMILDTQLHITMYVAKCYSSNLSDMEKRGYWILQEHEPCKLCLTLSNWGEKSDPKHF